MVKPAAILVVDDCADDILILRRAFEMLNLPNRLIAVTGGQEAIRYLAGEGQFTNRTRHPLPGLVLLDLKMPGVGGIEVLMWVRTQPELKKMPVVVLTTSDQVYDMRLAYICGANAFLFKSTSFKEYMESVKGLSRFGLGPVAPPRPDGPAWQAPGALS